jgi:predicted permease
MRKLLRRIHYVLNRRRAAAELAEEIEAHRLMRQAQLERSGMAERDASFSSKRAMGNALVAAARARDVWIWRWVDDASRDVLLGLRAFRNAPGFPLGASLILSLGIGINVAVFQLLDVAYWRPPDIREPASVVQLYRSQEGGFSYPAARMFDAHAGAFSSFFLREGFPSRRLIWGDNPANRVLGSFVSSNWFDALGIRPTLGRVFAAADDGGGAPPAVVISQVLWKGLLASDPDIVGKSVRVNNRLATVVGVVPPDVMPAHDMVWLPIALFDYFVPGDDDYRTSWDGGTGCCNGVEVYGRLRAGVSTDAVRHALQPLMKELHRLDPKTFEEREFFVPSPARARFADPRGGPVLFFLGMPPVVHLTLALLILLIASANLTTLVLSRAMNRVRDLSIRVSLGAGRWRILRQLMVENALLGLFSSAIGLVFVYWWTRLVRARGPVEWDAMQLDIVWRTVVAALVLASIAAVAIGLLPAWKISRSDLTTAIKDGGQQMSAGLHRTRWRHLLLGTQVAGSCLLLVLMGVIVRSLQHGTTNVGFNQDNVAMLTLAKGRKGLNAKDVPRYWSALGETLDSDWNVDSVSLISQLGSDVLRSDTTGPVSYYEVGPQFFTVMRISFVAGRDFKATDSFGSAAIISRRLAMRLYGTTNVIGRPVFPSAALRTPDESLAALAKAQPDVIIVGVAADTNLAGQLSAFQSRDLAAKGQEAAELYLPLNPKGSARALLVRGRFGAARVLQQWRTAALKLDTGLVPDARLLGQDIAERREGTRVLGIALAVLGLLAFSITCIGMALGAARRAMLLLLLKQLRWPLGAGVALGLAAAVQMGQVMSVAAMLPVKPLDPPILALVGGFVLFTAVAAALWPASRAVRQAPMDSLRSE